MPTGVRRTPGLLREEIAVRAGVSTDHHVRLDLRTTFDSWREITVGADFPARDAAPGAD
ncbi:hypothetical protein [Streptomyces sp. NBC_00986]|uniref:hypothetical protein n=1 Tax=Streptomyces sp. NBC_00986 TaxID=2903702 RepID=UPI00386587A0